MNNSRIAIEKVNLTLEEESAEATSYLQRREGQLVRIIEAIEKIRDSSEWSTLKQHIFGDLADNLDKRIRFEAKKQLLDQPEIYRLQGQLNWATKYADLDTLANSYRLELSNIKNKKLTTQPTER